jgi:23S rRNA pseudouridine1911/1915/1917 synthase
VKPTPFIVPPQLDGRPLDGVLRTLGGLSWSKARKQISTGKVTVRGVVAEKPEQIVAAGDTIEVRSNAPRRRPGPYLSRSAIAYVDAQVVVVRKPAGVSTVPYEAGERGTLDQLVAELLHREQPKKRPGPPGALGVVQRLDKETSGLIVFARTWSAKKALAHQLRMHTMHRRYLAIAHGSVVKQTCRSHIVKDRGDRLRGVARRGETGQLAITHVEPVERLVGATLVACGLETGRTHQIRIHLAEAGHPVVGERVYVRDYAGPLLNAPRIMLHATELGFAHPITGETLRFEEPPPPDFDEVLASLRRGG